MCELPEPAGGGGGHGEGEDAAGQGRGRAPWALWDVSGRPMASGYGRACVLALSRQLHPDARLPGTPPRALPRAVSPPSPSLSFPHCPGLWGSGRIGAAHRFPAARGVGRGLCCARTQLGTRTPPTDPPEPPASTPKSSVHCGQEAKGLGPASEGCPHAEQRPGHWAHSVFDTDLQVALVLKNHFTSLSLNTAPHPIPPSHCRLQATYPDAVGPQLQHLQLM